MSVQSTDAYFSLLSFKYCDCVLLIFFYYPVSMYTVLLLAYVTVERNSHILYCILVVFKASNAIKRLVY